jgi:hypothetical protein
MFLTALNQLCTEHKAARRYCRLKVLPPLKAQDVERRPDVGADFRNKLVRLMTDNASRNGELAAEFLFILCKRSGFFCFILMNEFELYMLSWSTRQICRFRPFSWPFGKLWVFRPSNWAKAPIGQWGLGDGRVQKSGGNVKLKFI